MRKLSDMVLPLIFGINALLSAGIQFKPLPIHYRKQSTASVPFPANPD